MLTQLLSRRERPGTVSAIRLLFALALAFAVPQVQAAPPPVEDFVRNPDVGEATISPSGTQIAMTIAMNNGHMNLAVLNLSPLGKPKVIAGFDDADVRNLNWVNDERIVYSALNRDISGSRSESSGLFAINADGSDKRQLVAFIDAVYTTGSGITSRMLNWQWNLYDTVDDGSPDIIVSESQFDALDDFKALNLERLNTLTGKHVPVVANAPEGARNWLLDKKGEARVVEAVSNGLETIYWRKGDDKTWTQLAQFKLYSGEGFTPWYYDVRGTLFVRTAHKADTQALFRYDIATQKLEDEPLVALSGFDLNPDLILDSKTDQLMGLNYVADQEGTAWFDKDMRNLQKAIDAALPKGRTNKLYCGRCASTRFFLVRSRSDRQPGEYYIFDRQMVSLLRIGATRPWLQEAALGRRSFERVAARDGMSIPVYITRPASAQDKQALPTVVLVHGGPTVRGFDLGYERDAQFLASRGYLVIETEFRGSYGYGTKLRKAGWKQWGLAMEDDLADATNWAIKQGLADPKRICIMGGSYGGYAALMGPIRNPELYRCVVASSAVTDIDMMFDLHWSDFSEDWKQYGLPKLVGDRKADAEQFRATSPLQQAAKIKVPVFLAHGSEDSRVPIDHARKFRAAAESAGVKLEWLVYAEEGHGCRKPANNIDYLKRVEAFLAKSMDATSP